MNLSNEVFAMRSIYAQSWVARGGRARYFGTVLLSSAA
jgi:hypothetical protein